MIPVLSQVCSLQSDFATDIADYAAGQCCAIEVWFTKLETFLQEHSVDDVRKLMNDHQVTLPVASFQGGLLTSQGDARSVAWEHFGKRLDLCKDLEISTFVVAADILAPLTQEAIDRALVSLGQVADLAKSKDIKVALEFQSRAAFINNLETANAVVCDIDSTHLGICLDAFHFFTGPSKFSDLEALDVCRLFHVQLSDVADVPREFASDSDRILPGDGDFGVERLIKQLQTDGYEGTVSIEVMDPQIWQIPRHAAR